MSDALAGTEVDLVAVTMDTATALLTGEGSDFAAATGYPHGDTADALQMFVAGGAEAGGCWFVVRRSDRLIIGDIGTRGGPDAQGTVEIGYGLASSARGRGHGTDAVRTLVAWLRSQPGVKRIEAGVLVDNLPSRRLLERLDFRVDRTESPHVYYVAPEWVH